uniref:OBG-type G domain-containing protein n=1 Tax=Setaria digitata TaxID=48799 RepID=A0A915Q2Q7_9BILA
MMNSFPSVGKSTLLCNLAGVYSEVAAYEFTTLTTVPGVIRYKGAKMQLLDLPGIIEGAKDGKGRGRQVIAVARTCSLILMILDVMKPLQHKKLLEQELEGFGIRLNKSPPNIVFKRKEKGGLNLTCLVPQSELDGEIVKSILAEYRIHNADVTLKYDATSEDLIDVIEGNRYTKPKGQLPDYNAPIVLPAETRTVDDLCSKIHKTLQKDFKFAYVWGSSAKHNPQRVGKEHVLNDEDVVQIVKRTINLCSRGHFLKVHDSDLTRKEEIVPNPGYTVWV